MPPDTAPADTQPIDPSSPADLSTSPTLPESAPVNPALSESVPVSSNQSESVPVSPSQSSSASVSPTLPESAPISPHPPHPHGGGRRGDRPISPETRARIDHNIAQKEERLAAILTHLDTHPTITSRDVRDMFGTSLQTAGTYLRDLYKKKKLSRIVTVVYSKK